MASTIVTRVSYAEDSTTLVDVSDTRTTTGKNSFRREITVTQAAEIEITLPTDIGDARECCVKNKDATNFITVAFATGVPLVRVYPGKACLFDLIPTQGSLFVQADTADVEATVIVHEA